MITAKEFGQTNQLVMEESLCIKKKKKNISQ